MDSLLSHSAASASSSGKGRRRGGQQSLIALDDPRDRQSQQRGEGRGASNSYSNSAHHTSNATHMTTSSGGDGSLGLEFHSIPSTAALPSADASAAAFFNFNALSSSAVPQLVPSTTAATADVVDLNAVFRPRPQPAPKLNVSPTRGGGPFMGSSGGGAVLTSSVSGIAVGGAPVTPQRDSLLPAAAAASVGTPGASSSYQLLMQQLHHNYAGGTPVVMPSSSSSPAHPLSSSQQSAGLYSSAMGLGVVSPSVAQRRARTAVDHHELRRHQLGHAASVAASISASVSGAVVAPSGGRVDENNLGEVGGRGSPNGGAPSDALRYAAGADADDVEAITRDDGSSSYGLGSLPRQASASSTADAAATVRRSSGGLPPKSRSASAHQSPLETPRGAVVVRNPNDAKAADTVVGSSAPPLAPTPMARASNGLSPSVAGEPSKITSPPAEMQVSPPQSLPQTDGLQEAARTPVTAESSSAPSSQLAAFASPPAERGGPLQGGSSDRVNAQSAHIVASPAHGAAAMVPRHSSQSRPQEGLMQLQRAHSPLSSLQQALAGVEDILRAGTALRVSKLTEMQRRQQQLLAEAERAAAEEAARAMAERTRPMPHASHLSSHRFVDAEENANVALEETVRPSIGRESASPVGLSSPPAAAEPKRGAVHSPLATEEAGTNTSAIAEHLVPARAASLVEASVAVGVAGEGPAIERAVVSPLEASLVDKDWVRAEVRRMLEETDRGRGERNTASGAEEGSKRGRWAVPPPPSPQRDGAPAVNGRDGDSNGVRGRERPRRAPIPAPTFGDSTTPLRRRRRPSSSDAAEESHLIDSPSPSAHGGLDGDGGSSERGAGGQRRRAGGGMAPPPPSPKRRTKSVAAANAQYPLSSPLNDTSVATADGSSVVPPPPPRLSEAERRSLAARRERDARWEVEAQQQLMRGDVVSAPSLLRPLTSPPANASVNTSFASSAAARARMVAAKQNGMSVPADGAAISHSLSGINASPDAAAERQRRQTDPNEASHPYAPLAAAAAAADDSATPSRRAGGGQRSLMPPPPPSPPKAAPLLPLSALLTVGTQTSANASALEGRGGALHLFGGKGVVLAHSSRDTSLNATPSPARPRRDEGGVASSGDRRSAPPPEGFVGTPNGGADDNAADAVHDGQIPSASAANRRAPGGYPTPARVVTPPSTRVVQRDGSVPRSFVSAERGGGRGNDGNHLEGLISLATRGGNAAKPLHAQQPPASARGSPRPFGADDLNAVPVVTVDHTPAESDPQSSSSTSSSSSSSSSSDGSSSSSSSGGSSSSSSDSSSDSSGSSSSSSSDSTLDNPPVRRIVVARRPNNSAPINQQPAAARALFARTSGNSAHSGAPLRGTYNAPTRGPSMLQHPQTDAARRGSRVSTTSPQSAQRKASPSPYATNGHLVSPEAALGAFFSSPAKGANQQLTAVAAAVLEENGVLRGDVAAREAELRAATDSQRVLQRKVEQLAANLVRLMREKEEAEAAVGNRRTTTRGGVVALASASPSTLSLRRRTDDYVTNANDSSAARLLAEVDGLKRRLGGGSPAAKGELPPRRGTQTSTHSLAPPPHHASSSFVAGSSKYANSTVGGGTSDADAAAAVVAHLYAQLEGLTAERAALAAALGESNGTNAALMEELRLVLAEAEGRGVGGSGRGIGMSGDGIGQDQQLLIEDRRSATVAPSLSEAHPTASRGRAATAEPPRHSSQRHNNSTLLVGVNASSTATGGSSTLSGSGGRNGGHNSTLPPRRDQRERQRSPLPRPNSPTHASVDEGSSSAVAAHPYAPAPIPPNASSTSPSLRGGVGGDGGDTTRRPSASVTNASVRRPSASANPNPSRGHSHAARPSASVSPSSRGVSRSVSATTAGSAIRYNGLLLNVVTDDGRARGAVAGTVREASSSARVTPVDASPSHSSRGASASSAAAHRPQPNSQGGDGEGVTNNKVAVIGASTSEASPPTVASTVSLSSPSSAFVGAEATATTGGPHASVSAALTPQTATANSKRSSRFVSPRPPTPSPPHTPTAAGAGMTKTEAAESPAKASQEPLPTARAAVPTPTQLRSPPTTSRGEEGRSVAKKDESGMVLTPQRLQPPPQYTAHSAAVRRESPPRGSRAHLYAPLPPPPPPTTTAADANAAEEAHGGAGVRSPFAAAIDAATRAGAAAGRRSSGPNVSAAPLRADTNAGASPRNTNAPALINTAGGHVVADNSGAGAGGSSAIGIAMLSTITIADDEGGAAGSADVTAAAIQHNLSALGRTAPPTAAAVSSLLASSTITAAPHNSTLGSLAGRRAEGDVAAADAASNGGGVRSASSSSSVGSGALARQSSADSTSSRHMHHSGSASMGGPSYRMGRHLHGSGSISGGGAAVLLTEDAMAATAAFANSSALQRSNVGADGYGSGSELIIRPSSRSPLRTVPTVVPSPAEEQLFTASVGGHRSGAVSAAAVHSSAHAHFASSDANGAMAHRTGTGLSFGGGGGAAAEDSDANGRDSPLPTSPYPRLGPSQHEGRRHQPPPPPAASP